jgi:aminoglycoside phosphotransferase (APT) family kinase protein
VTPVSDDGWDNCTFHLGRALSVRMPSAEPYAPGVDKEQRWLPMLAPLLPLPIPVPVARGVPGSGYPWKWSVYRWLEGETARLDRIADADAFARTLGGFLAALQQVDPTDGPSPGPHNFFRGGPLTTYDEETRRAIATLADEIPTRAVTDVWERALAATWSGTPVWFHGDVAATNLLVTGGRLSAVIDFGTSGVGDPACDTVIAWTFLSGESRATFRAAYPADDATWTRGRGWALWKGLITMVQHRTTNPAEAARARAVVDEVVAEHEQLH